jgi:hypothetical protein
MDHAECDRGVGIETGCLDAHLAGVYEESGESLAAFRDDGLCRTAQPALWGEREIHDHFRVRSQQRTPLFCVKHDEG